MQLRTSRSCIKEYHMSDTKHITKTVDQTVNGTTFTDDNELQFVAHANTTWALHFDLFTSADDVVGNNDRWISKIKAPSSATVTARVFAIINDGNGGTATTVALLGTSFGWGAPGSVTNPAYAWIRMQVLVQMGSDSGQVGLQFAEVANASATGAVVYAGSTLSAEKR